MMTGSLNWLIKRLISKLTNTQLTVWIPLTHWASKCTWEIPEAASSVQWKYCHFLCRSQPCCQHVSRARDKHHTKLLFHSSPSPPYPSFPLSQWWMWNGRSLSCSVSFPHSQELLKPENSAQLQQSFEVHACCTSNRLAKEFSAVDAEDHWQIMLSTAHREMGLCGKAKPYWDNKKPQVLILSRSLSQTCSQAQFCNVMMYWNFSFSISLKATQGQPSLFPLKPSSPQDSLQSKKGHEQSPPFACPFQDNGYCELKFQ